MKILLMMALAITVSCSKSPNSQKNTNSAPSDLSSEVINFGELNISIPANGDFQGSALDFASLAFKQSGTQSIVLTNSVTVGNLVLTAADFDTLSLAPFTIESNTCISAPILPRRTCIVKLGLTNLVSLATEQNLTSLLKIKNKDFTLTGILEADQTVPDAPNVAITVSPLELNFGTMKEGETKELSLVVKNSTMAAIAIPLTAISNSNMLISYNACSATLSSRRSCVIKLKYTAVAEENRASEDLMFAANYQVKYSVIVKNPSITEPETFQIFPQVEESNLTLTQPSITPGAIRFSNTGTRALSAPVSAISSHPGIVITSVSCTGGLQRSRVCDISYNVVSASLPSGASVQHIRLQSGTIASESFSINLNVTPNEMACTIEDAIANGVVVANSNLTPAGIKVGSNVQACVLASTACNQYYSLDVANKNCIAQTIACSPADTVLNGWIIDNALSYTGNRVGSDYSQCNVLNCKNNYEKIAKDCSAIACTIDNANINNVLTVSGTLVSGCSVVSCENEYEQIGNACNAISCNLTNAVGNGLISAENVTTVTGTINDNSCSVTSCSPYYQFPLGNPVSCSAKLCNQLSPAELTTLQYSLPNGSSIAGTYPSCVLTCPAGMQVSASNKTCEDKDVIGSTILDIINTTSLVEYTSSPTYVIENSFRIKDNGIQNATEIAISFNGCPSDISQVTFSPISTILSQPVSIPVAKQNTSINLAAIYKNGSKTLCAAKTIIHDNFVPMDIFEYYFSEGVNPGENGVVPQVNWSSSFDGGSGLSKYEYSIGLANTQDVSIKNWTSAGLSTVLSQSTQTLIDNTAYEFRLRAVDKAGNVSPTVILSLNSIYRKTQIGKVAVGDTFNCAIKNYGVVCWGMNDRGQLGVNYNEITGSSTPVQTSLTSGVTDISADGKTACAIKNSELYCWGDNTYGQLGLQFTGSVKDVPFKVFGLGTGVTSVSVGGRHVCAIKDGKVYCWGENQFGRLGQGTIPTTSSTNALDTVQPVCITTPCNTTTVANHLQNVSKISVGFGHSCALTENKLYCWGYNLKGQLGIGTVVNSGLATVVLAGATNFYDVAAGFSHTCATRMNQAGSPAAYSLRLLCWGSQLSGALGDGVITDTIKQIASAVNITTTGSIQQIKAGINTTCINSTVGIVAPLTQNLKCFGANTRGQVGNSTLVATSYPTESAVGLRYPNATTMGSVYDFDMNSHNEFDAVNSHACASDAGKISCWGYNGNGVSHNVSIIGDPAREPLSPGENSVITAPYTIPSLVGNTYSSLASSGTHSCVVHNGALKCWGVNSSGQLGNGTITNSLTPITPSGFDKGVREVEVGEENTCAIKAGTLFCWGYNGHAQIGNNTTVTPVTTPYATIASDAIAITMSGSSTQASMGGVAYGWGDNAFFMSGDSAYSGLGIYTYPASGVSRPLVPTQVCGVGQTACATSPLMSVTKISNNGESGMAVAAGKAVYWGRSTSAGYSRVPVYLLNTGGVSEAGVTDVMTRLFSAYEGMGCTLRNGSAYCFGYLPSGQSGYNIASATDTTRPGVAASTNYLSSFSKSAARADAPICAKRLDQIVCWGQTFSGAFANGIKNHLQLPTAVLTSNVGVISSSDYSACAEQNGFIKCWGNIGREAFLGPAFGPAGVSSSLTPVILDINYVP